MRRPIACVILLLGSLIGGLAEPLHQAGTTETVVAPQETIVYVTRTGKKYHRKGCRYLRRSKIPMERSLAQRIYLPCFVCRP